MLLTMSLVAVGVSGGSATAATQTFTNPALIDIPDNDVASPYPSTINVSGFAGNVENATVTFHGFQHTCWTDVATLLVGPSGVAGVPMAYVGPCPGSSSDPAGPFDVTFDSGATNPFGEESGSGTYLPTADGPVELSEPAPAGEQPETLNVFNGAPANGTWSLFVEDQSGADFGQINGGWSLTLDAPKNNLTTGAATLNKKKGTALVPVKVDDDGRLTLTGNGVATVAAPSASKSADVLGPATVNLPVRATGKKKKKLNSKGKVSVNVTITFTPRGGAAKSTPLTVTLQKKIKK